MRTVFVYSCHVIVGMVIGLSGCRDNKKVQELSEAIGYCDTVDPREMVNYWNLLEDEKLCQKVSENERYGRKEETLGTLGASLYFWGDYQGANTILRRSLRFEKPQGLEILRTLCYTEVLCGQGHGMKMLTEENRRSIGPLFAICSELITNQTNLSRLDLTLLENKSPKDTTFDVVELNDLGFLSLVAFRNEDGELLVRLAERAESIFLHAVNVKTLEDVDLGIIVRSTSRVDVPYVSIFIEDMSADVLDIYYRTYQICLKKNPEQVDKWRKKVIHLLPQCQKNPRIGNRIRSRYPYGMQLPSNMNVNPRPMRPDGKK